MAFNFFSLKLGPQIAFNSFYIKAGSSDGIHFLKLKLGPPMTVNFSLKMISVLENLKRSVIVIEVQKDIIMDYVYFCLISGDQSNVLTWQGLTNQQR